MVDYYYMGTTTITKIIEDKAVVNLPPAVGKILEKGGEAVIDIGNFTITIVPKLKMGSAQLRVRRSADAKLWQRLEQVYRGVRAELTRERYPCLYGGQHS